MEGLSKHREEKSPYRLNFVDELDEDETITGTPAVQVEGYTKAAGWAEKSTEFLNSPASPVVAGTTVTVELKAAADGQQIAGDYRLEIKIATSASRTIVGVAPLKVVDGY